MRDYSRSLVFRATATAVALVLASPAHAQVQEPPEAEAAPAAGAPAVAQTPEDPAAGAPAEYEDEGEEIVVTGVRRGTVIGDIPPENTLSARDVRATGATDITELLDALAPQIGSARGRGGERPVLLLNGQRISSFREMRDIPTEAIERVDILPEEVALKYGYRADQRVVNIVLRPRFRSTVVQVEGGGATEGNYGRGELDVDRLMIGQNGRTMFSIDADANDALLEANRDIDLDPDSVGPDERAFRTLTGSRRYLRGSATLNRQIFGDVSGTFNGEVEDNVGRSLVGLDEAALEPLVRNTRSNTAHLGAALNGNKGKWRWSATGNADLARSLTRTDRENETERDRSRTFTTSADVDVTANGPLFKLPAGDASMTVRLGASTFNLDATRTSAIDSSDNDLSRTRGSGSVNFDFPISRRNRDFSALGNLTLNANAEVEQLSDFGTLTTIGAGLNWSPVDRLSFLATWTREEGAPSVSQLGDPILETPETRVFDFTTGETLLVTTITGGNPELLADRRKVLKIGGNWKPWEETDLRLRAEYVRSRLDRPVASFPGVSEALQEAFPERFFFEDGELVLVDFRPVNYDQARRDTIRWGFDFTKPLRSARPSQAAIDRFRSRRAAETGQSSGAPAEGQPGGPPPEGGPPAEGAGPPAGGLGGGFGGGRGGFGGRFGRGRQGGRLQLSLTHTVNLVDEVTIRPGLPELDYLNGDALGSTGGRSRHELEAQGGYFNNGLGARLSARFRSATRVDSRNGEELRFSRLATFNLRVFANLGERFDLVSKHPWLRGTSVRFEVNNLFNSKPKVRNAAGEAPFSYQPDLLDPLGRTVSISFRKLFLPPRGAFRRQQTSPQN
jgi:hypothetical protein